MKETVQGRTAGGSNAPLRGGKGSNWEGGHRTPTFVSGPWLPDAMRGRRLDGLAHVTDWYVTFSGLAGVDSSDPGGVSPVDGKNLWPWLSGTASASPRTMIVHDHNHICPGPNGTKTRCANTWGALRKNEWKLIIGQAGKEGQASWFGEFTPNVTVPQPEFPKMACSHSQPCLFNLQTDLEEHEDVAASHPEVVQDLLAEFGRLEDEYHPNITCDLCVGPGDVDGYCQYVAANNEFLGPWRE